MQKRSFTAKTFRLACCLCLGAWCCFFLPLVSEAGDAYKTASPINTMTSSHADNGANRQGNGASMQAEATGANISSPCDKNVASETEPASLASALALNKVTPDRATRGKMIAVSEVSDSEVSGCEASGSGASGTVDYESMVVAKKGSEMLALYNTLSDPVDKGSLDNLARDCFQKVHGNLYKKVLVNWYLPGQSKGDKPWAVSNFADGQEVIEILDEEMVKKFPSVKRWQQPGHDPLPR